MVICHHGNLDRVAEEQEQLAENGGHSLELVPSDAARCVQHEQNVLLAVRPAPRRAPVARSVLGDVEWSGLGGKVELAGLARFPVDRSLQFLSNRTLSCKGGRRENMAVYTQ